MRPVDVRRREVLILSERVNGGEELHFQKKERDVSRMLPLFPSCYRLFSFLIDREWGGIHGYAKGVYSLGVNR